MTLATRCNACTTVFRVVRDQLRVSDGWVRCGRCNAVFNATDDLFELDEGPVSAEASGAADPPTSADLTRQRLDEVLDDLAEHRRRLQQSEAAAPAVWSRPTAPRPAEPLRDEFSFDDDAGWDEPTDPVDSVGDELPNEDDPDPALDEAGTAELDQAAEPLEPAALAAWRDDGDYERAIAAIDGDEPAEADVPAQAESRNAAAAEIDPATAATASDMPASDQTDAGNDGLIDDGRPAAIVAWQHEPPLADPGTAIYADAPPTEAALAGAAAVVPAVVPSFIRRADRAAFWQSTQVRRSLGVTAGVLGLLLLLQAGRAGRDMLAAHVPALEPALQALCRIGACEVAALRRIDRVSVDSAGLGVVEGASVYRLQLLLHNRADTAVLAPALELTLNDAQGRLLARRVLQGAELGLPSPVLSAGQELPLQVMLAAREQRIAGYNVELFYP